MSMTGVNPNLNESNGLELIYVINVNVVPLLVV
jgi:hypothetical protein